jgi:hypothetical protein
MPGSPCLIAAGTGYERTVTSGIQSDDRVEIIRRIEGRRQVVIRNYLLLQRPSRNNRVFETGIMASL